MRFLLPAICIFFCAFTQTDESPPRPVGKDYALFFAIDDYSSSPDFADLKNPVNDAQAIKKELEEMYDFQADVYINASKQRIFQVLADWQNVQFNAEDQVFIFFSGHGDFDEFVKKGYFITADNQWIDLTDLANIIRQFSSSHTLLAIDACYSGTIDQEVALKGRGSRPGANSAQEKKALINKWLRNKSQLFITSGGKERTPDGKDHSPFSQALLDVLRASYTSGDGLVNFQDILSRFELVFPTPHYGELAGHQGGSFVFVAKDALQVNTYGGTNTPLDFDPNFPCKHLGGDQDGDGICSENDCDDTNPNLLTSSDTDGDGICDDRDQCRNRPGTRAQNGCPTVEDGLVFIQGGTFQMGCQETVDQDCGEKEYPVHPVRVGAFYLSRYEVTQAQWRRVMGVDPAKLHNKACDECPVEGVNWKDVLAFLQKLNQQTGERYRLPTEVEWEYAARGGVLSEGFLYSGANHPDSISWYTENAQRRNPHGNQQTTRPVATKLPNELGLYDMSGNVAEWCENDMEDYPIGDVVEPSGAGLSLAKVIRGGSWHNEPSVLRVTHRGYIHPRFRVSGVGFRIAKSY